MTGKRRKANSRRQRPSAAPTLVIAVAAVLVAAPIVATFAGALSGAEAQAHIWSTNGVRYFATTVVLCASTGAAAAILGAAAAMIVSLTDFPGRRFFTVALALPFAVPAYISAYAYADFLGPFGAASAVFGAGALPEIRSLPGAVFILALATYPYVYLAMRASLSARSSAFMEAARVLGASPKTAALRVLLGAGRPALVGGLALALMETAADYGVADFFGVQTLSVGIFRAWHGLGDLAAATQIAAGLFLIVLLLVLIEEVGRRGKAGESVRAQRASARLKLSRAHAAIAIAACSAPIILGAAVPAGVLIAKINPDMTVGAARGLTRAISNTTFVAGVGAVAATALAVMLAYSARAAASVLRIALLRAATLGYAIPGAVVAVGILALTADLNRFAAAGVWILIYAYVARFLTAAYNTATAGLEQISLQMDAAAKSLGAGPARILTAVHWPIARGAVLSGAAIVAVDIAKELPATLLLRPFNFETLSTRIYRLASDERLADAAPAALMLIALGLVPTLALSFFAERRDRRRLILRRGKRGASPREKDRDSVRAA